MEFNTNLQASTISQSLNIDFDSIKMGDTSKLTITESSVNQQTGIGTKLGTDIQNYGGWQHGEKVSTDIRLLNDDKQTIDPNDPFSVSYQEISGVTGTQNEAHAKELSDQILKDKLMGGNLSVSKENSQSGNVQLEYGAHKFSPNVMYGMDNYENSPNKSRYPSNEYSADVSFTTKSGNTIDLKFSFKEEVETVNSWSKGALESFEDYDKRVMQAINNGPESKSDYRKLAISYSAGQELSEEDSHLLNKINNYLLSSAVASGSGHESSQRKLEAQFSDIKNEVSSFSLDGKFEGFAQNDNSFSVDILNGALESSLEFEKTPSGINHDTKSLDRFWDG